MRHNNGIRIVEDVPVKSLEDFLTAHVIAFNDDSKFKDYVTDVKSEYEMDALEKNVIDTHINVLKKNTLVENITLYFQFMIDEDKLNSEELAELIFDAVKDPDTALQRIQGALDLIELQDNRKK